MDQAQRVAVFCGSSRSVNQHFLDLAAEVGTALANRSIGLVYGGGNSGLMGAVADAAMAAGGHVTGVLPGGLFDNGIADDRVSDLEIVADMHERKARMYELSDGFLGLPGGLGTFEEVFEAATWSQLGLHTDGRRKPVVLLDRDGYWEPVQNLLDRATDEQFMATETRAIVRRVQSIPDAFDGLLTP